MALSLALRLGLGGASASAPFDPASLFSGSDAGAVYDFTDAARLGTTTSGPGGVTYGSPIAYASDLGPSAKPVTQATAANQPLFRGVPRAWGSNLTTNPRFVSDTDWTKGTGWTIGSGVATKAAGTASLLSQAITLTAGKSYLVHFNITRSAGSITPQFTGGTTVSAIARSATGSYTEIMTAVTGNTTIALSADASFAGTVDNFTACEITSWAALGADFDGVNDILTSAAIDLSASQKATLVVCSTFSQDPAAMVSCEFGNSFGGTAGSFAARWGPVVQCYLRGTTSLVNRQLTTNVDQPNPYTASMTCHTYQIDLSSGTAAGQIGIRSNGIVRTGTDPTAAGGGNLANSTFQVGAANGTAAPWKGLIHRVFLINRQLTAGEIVQVENWARSGKKFAAILGDSTVAETYSTLPICTGVAPLTGKLLATNLFNMAYAGHRIADQLALWNAITDYSALEQVVVQIGLNDVKGRVGGGTATSAQVIADYQALIDQINADAPQAAVYVSQMTPCKVWLDASTSSPANAYAAWQELNAAIAGSGSTPITGVDGRITAHVALLKDGSDNLLPEYDYNNDGVHESAEARRIIADAWADVI